MDACMYVCSMYFIKTGHQDGGIGTTALLQAFVAGKPSSTRLFQAIGSIYRHLFERAYEAPGLRGSQPQTWEPTRALDRGFGRVSASPGPMGVTPVSTRVREIGQRSFDHHQDHEARLGAGRSLGCTLSPVVQSGSQLTYIATL
jgi:hypothetical protein